LAAEILFLRKQLVFYQERKIKPRRFDDAARLSMMLFSKFFDWKNALINVKPETFTGWHKKAFQLFWLWKSRSGRPRLPRNIQRLIAEMAINNPTWGQERLANELSLKLGILVSPRTVKKHWPDGISSGPRRVSSQRWTTFIHNHASALVACDFATVVTATFRRLYVLVVMEIGTWRILGPFHTSPARLALPSSLRCCGSSRQNESIAILTAPQLRLEIGADHICSQNCSPRQLLTSLS
jgi:hypothetical protein